MCDNCDASGEVVKCRFVDDSGFYTLGLCKDCETKAEMNEMRTDETKK